MSWLLSLNSSEHPLFSLELSNRGPFPFWTSAESPPLTETSIEKHHCHQRRARQLAENYVFAWSARPRLWIDFEETRGLPQLLFDHELHPAAATNAPYRTVFLP